MLSLEKASIYKNGSIYKNLRLAYTETSKATTNSRLKDEKAQLSIVPGTIDEIEVSWILGLKKICWATSVVSIEQRRESLW